MKKIEENWYFWQETWMQNNWRDCRVTSIAFQCFDTLVCSVGLACILEKNWRKPVPSAFSQNASAVCSLAVWTVKASAFTTTKLYIFFLKGINSTANTEHWLREPNSWYTKKANKKGFHKLFFATEQTHCSAFSSSGPHGDECHTQRKEKAGRIWNKWSWMDRKGRN